MNDLRFAFRQLLKNPGFTAVAVLTLALGIGANTAVFSVINAVLIRSLPFPDPERLFSVWQEYPKRSWPRANFSLPNFRDLRSETNLFANAGAFTRSSHTLTEGGEPRRLNSIRVSSGLLPTLGVQPVLGRNFLDEEDHPDGERVALLGERLWRTQFQADPGIVGRRLRLNDEWSVTIIGVTPAEFQIGGTVPELCLPLRINPAEVGRGQRSLEVIARLNPSIGAPQLRAGLVALAGRLRDADPWANGEMEVNSRPLRAQLVGEIRTPLLLLSGAVMCVLLIACANVANLFLVRALSRQTEMTIRAAVGASRWQIVRLLLVEGLVVALLGGSVGFLLGQGCVSLAKKLLAAQLPQVPEFGLDPAVLAFTLLVAAGCGVLFGLAPALSVSRINLATFLREDARNSTPGRLRFRLRSVLVATEVALAFVLLAGAGLMTRSVIRLTTFDPGFDSTGMLVANTAFTGKRYSGDATRLAAVREITLRLRSLPGVAAVTFGDSLPMTDGMDASVTAIEGRVLTPGEAPFVRMRAVGDDYFQTLRVPLLEGRHLATSDNETAQKVAVVNATMARRLWPGESALSKRIRPESLDSENWLTVVGVVADMKNEAVTQAPRPEVYFPFAQHPAGGVSLMLRTSVPPLTLAETVRREIWKVDGTLAITALRTMEQTKTESFSSTRLQSLLLGAFAGLALILAATGIYGVLSYSVRQRSREIGIRMALGAQATSVHALVLGGSLKVVLIGMALGLAAALLLTRFMETLLFQVGATDPVTIIATAVTLIVVAVAASYLPARRAARLDPMRALHTD